MKILALDPALRTGFAHSNGQRGVWLLSSDPAEHPGLRMLRLCGFIRDAYKAWGFAKLACEDAGFGSRNPAVQALHNELRGAIKGTAAELGVPVVLYVPSTIKLHTTGSGRATKDQMMAAVRTMYGVTCTDDNVADAVAILKMAEAGVRPPHEVRQRVLANRRKTKRREPKLF